MIDLSGRRVLITGASRGIGAACARLFGRSGAAVLVHYGRQVDAARQVLEGLTREHPSEPHRMFGAELADPAAIDALFAFVRREWGALDCLVNNAGIWVRNPLATLDAELLQETWQVNVTSAFQCAHQAIGLLAASSDGNIVNLSSTAGQRGEAFYSPYAASKGALISATKAWSTELAPAVRVNCVAPGWVDTEMSASALHGPERASIEAAIPLRRVATAEDIAGAVLFLASALARQITGEIVNVNGGSVLAG
ncbi:MAG: SDR family oxidoreductase [Acidobacteriota bacterium]